MLNAERFATFVSERITTTYGSGQRHIVVNYITT